MTLNTPKSLNALSVEMSALAQQLEQWQNDDQIGIGIKKQVTRRFVPAVISVLYDSMSTRAPLPNPYATEFFGREYRGSID